MDDQLSNTIYLVRHLIYSYIHSEEERNAYYFVKKKDVIRVQTHNSMMDLRKANYTQ